MSLVSIIKSKIEECNQIIHQDLQSPTFKEKVARGIIPSDKVAQYYEQNELQSADFRRSYPALMMQKNQAKHDLEALTVELNQTIKKNTKLFLVEDSQDQIKKLLSDKVCFQINHTDMARKIATFVMPAIHPGDVLNAHLISIINDVLDNVEEEIGVSSFLTERLQAKADCIEVIENLDKLTHVIEYMIESQLYPNDEVPEGHMLQAIFNAKQYMDAILTEENESHYVCVVFVPKLSQWLIQAYSNFLSANISTVSYSDQSSVAGFLDKLPSKIETEPMDTVKKPKKNKA